MRLLSLLRVSPAVGLLAGLAACQRDTALPLAPDFSHTVQRTGNLFPYADPSGMVATYSASGSIDGGNPFFQSLGTNGRSCASCHLPSDAWGLSAAHARQVFAASGGTDPLFAAVDGANCPSAAPGDAGARSLLLGHGLIRVGLTLPAGAQYTIAAVHDPYGCGLVTDAQGVTTVSVYRRPLPTTNLGFLSAVMFDGRETGAPLTDAQTFSANLRSDLAHQAMDATLGHAQAAASPTAAQLSQIVQFELGLFSAQVADDSAGQLGAQGAEGGPLELSNQAFYPGINDPLGGNPTGAAFDPQAFTLFESWLDLSGDNSRYAASREAVARGERLFNTHPLTITGVKGLNDALGAPAINGTCTTCHDSPNVGNHSRPVPLDIGTSHAAAYEGDPRIAAGLARLSEADLPVYQISCNAGPLAGTVQYSNDPAKALLTGLCADVGRGKGPILRGLAARAPYFHNGAAATLDQVVSFYDQRFQMGLTPRERADIVAFLKSL
jgi:cytochrome c peroxidase